ncbi:hypothetical protein KP13_31966 [Klebsiella pneumoniae subsp. pneumoniae Kp13]|nr:hypothetical protein KP13_31966 [Klebsiella pneumoniae subsp. pneumoniae Kp13]
MSIYDCITKSPQSGIKKQAVIPRTKGNKMSAQSDDRCQWASSLLVITAANTRDIKLIADTLDALQTVSPGQKHRLCLNRG